MITQVAESLPLQTERLERPLPIAEHGFSDALEISARELQAIVLSYGHFDHSWGLLVDRLGDTHPPLVLPPDAYLERRLVLPSGQEPRMPTPLQSDFRRDGIEEVGPSMLVDQLVLVSGEVARTTPFERGMPVHWAERNGEWQPDPLIYDDQCAIVHLAGRGLVVITGCHHAATRSDSQVEGAPRGPQDRVSTGSLACWTSSSSRSRRRGRCSSSSRSS